MDNPLPAIATALTMAGRAGGHDVRSTAEQEPGTATPPVTRLGAWAMLIGTATTATVFVAWDGWYGWSSTVVFLASTGSVLGASFVVWLVGARRLPRLRSGAELRDRRAGFVVVPFGYVATVGLAILWRMKSYVVASATTDTAIDRPDHAVARVIAAAPIVFAGLLATAATRRGDLLAARPLNLRRAVVVAAHAAPVVLIGWVVALAPNPAPGFPIVEAWVFGSVVLALGILLWLGGSPWLLIVADELSSMVAAVALLQALEPDDFDLALVTIAGPSVAPIVLLAAGSATLFLALIAAAGIAPPPMSSPVARSFATIETWLHRGENG